MKFWLDTTITGQSSFGECTDDDDGTDGTDDKECNPPGRFIGHYSIGCDSAKKAETIHHSRTHVFQQTTPLYLQECAPDRWVACNPTGEGHIIVLDTQAKRLMEQFCHARSFEEVLPAFTDVAPEAIEHALVLLYRTGLLECPLLPPVSHESTEDQVLSAWLHVTNACNLRCHYCYLAKTSENMAEDTALQAIDAIFRSATKRQFKQVRLRYAGGEASLHMSRVVAVHDYALQLARQYGIALRATLLSNGVVLSRHTIDSLKSRQIGVTISLDGVGDYHDQQRPFLHGHGSFKYVDRTITALLEHDLAPHITVTVSERNLDGLPDLLTYILEHGLTFTLSYYRDNDCAVLPETLRFSEQRMISAMHAAFGVIESNLPQKRLLASLIDKASLYHPHQRTCGVGQNYLVIDQRGGIAKCQAAIQQTVATIATEDPLQLIRADRSGIQGLPVEEKEGCRTCDWRYWCTGGCPLLTYRATGRYNIKSPNCGIYKALFPAALRLEALRLLKYTTPIALE